MSTPSRSPARSCSEHLRGGADQRTGAATPLGAVATAADTYASGDACGCFTTAVRCAGFRIAWKARSLSGLSETAPMDDFQQLRPLQSRLRRLVLWRELGTLAGHGRGRCFDREGRARRRVKRVVQLLLAPGNASVVGGLDRTTARAVVRLSLGRGPARACRRSTAAPIALACSPKRGRSAYCPRRIYIVFPDDRPLQHPSSFRRYEGKRARMHYVRRLAVLTSSV
jgi:hypothetical protein